MSRLVLLLALSLSLPGFAKPWQGIVPGQSSPLDVIGKFGEPTQRVTQRGQTVMVYSGLQAPPGTVQAQFTLSPAGDAVARIDVYPAPVIDAPAVEKSYGPRCEGKPPKEPCYREKGEGPKAYFLFPKLGLAVFFKPDKTVESFAFLPEKS